MSSGPDPFALAPTRPVSSPTDRRGPPRRRRRARFGLGPLRRRARGRADDRRSPTSPASRHHRPPATGVGALDRGRRPSGAASSSAASTSTRATTPAVVAHGVRIAGRGRLPDGRAHERRRLAPHRVADRPAGADQRPHQPHRPLAAHRCPAAGAVRAHASSTSPTSTARRLRDARPRASTRRSPKASTSASPDRTSRRPPRSAWRRRSVAISSGCPPCSRPSPPATSAPRCSACRWPPTSPPASARCPLDGDDVIAAGDAAAGRLGRAAPRRSSARLAHHVPCRTISPSSTPPSSRWTPGAPCTRAPRSLVDGG